ncbi:fatty acid desaturase [Rhodospirillaceae bacterium SYSU D60014]|uniref:fatty acid desaturase n=1 Tax=Virgifigura deserti TaxID=2268457 RepID=UPI000E66D1DD
MPVFSGDPEHWSFRTSVSRYQSPSLAKSVGQIANSFLPFLGLCALMYASLDLNYGITFALAIPAAGFVVRIFIIQHDCGHGAFFRSRRANAITGTLCSLVTLAPYAHWRRQHAGHHANWNNLDRRLSGLDIYSSCLTTDEYRNLDAWRRAAYRVSRHPLVSLVVLPPLVFLLLYRVPFDTPRSWKEERRAVHLTNLALIGLVLALGFTLGFPQVLMVQLPICVIAAIFGVFLFSLQHRFENTLWARREDWNFVAASVQGSSYLKLPRILQWFTGNIGFHHVHHLNPRIPNYRLQACHDANPVLQAAPVLTLWSGLRSVRYALWDEQQGRMVPFRPLR